LNQDESPRMLDLTPEDQ